MAATNYAWTRLICSECKDPRSYLFRADSDRSDAYTCSRCPYGHVTDDAVTATLAPGQIHVYLDGAVHIGSAESTASTDAVEGAGTSESAASATKHDWRGTAITEGSLVLFPRKWGRSGYSTEMTEDSTSSTSVDVNQ
jgi:hypothetical protein